MSSTGASQLIHPGQPFQSFSTLTTPLTGYGHQFEIPYPPGTMAGVGGGNGYGYGEPQDRDIECLPVESREEVGDEEMKDNDQEQGGEEIKVEDGPESAASSQLTSLSSENDSQPIHTEVVQPRSRSTSAKRKPPLPPQANSVRSPPRTRAYAASLANELEKVARSRSSTASKREVKATKDLGSTSILIPTLPPKSGSHQHPIPPQQPVPNTRSTITQIPLIPTLFSPSKIVTSPEGITLHSNSALFRYFGLTPLEYSAAARRDAEERRINQQESEEEEPSEESMGDGGSDKENFREEEGLGIEDLEGEISMSTDDSRITIESEVSEKSKSEVKVRVSSVVIDGEEGLERSSLTKRYVFSIFDNYSSLHS